MFRNYRATREILLPILFTFIILSLGGCQNGKTGQPAKNVKITLLRENSYMMRYLLLIRDKFLASHLPAGVTVEWSVIPNQADQRDSLISGQSDIGSLGIGVMISARENGAPLVPLSYSSAGYVGLFSVSDKINAIGDITANEKITISSISDGKHIAFMLTLKELYDDAHKFDNNMLVMDYADMYASVQTNDDIATALLGFPDSETALDAGFARQVIDLSDVLNTYSLGNVVATTEDFAKNNPAFIDAFYHAMDDAVRYIEESPQEAFAFLSGYMQIKPALLQAEYARRTPQTRISESGYDKLAAFMYEIGLLDHEPQKFRDLPNYATLPKTE